jgi:hypothetical protein
MLQDTPLRKVWFDNGEGHQVVEVVQVVGWACFNGVRNHIIVEQDRRQGLVRRAAHRPF